MNPLLLLGAGAALLWLVSSKSEPRPTVGMPGSWKPSQPGPQPGAQTTSSRTGPFTAEHIEVVNGQQKLTQAGFKHLLGKLSRDIKVCRYESDQGPEGFFGSIDLSSGKAAPKCNAPERPFSEIFGDYFKSAGKSVTYLLYPRPQDTTEGEVMTLFVFDTKAAAALPKNHGMIYLGTPEELDAGGF